MKSFAKIFSMLLVLSLLLFAFPSSAFADEQPSSIKDVYTIDGVTYFNVNSKNTSTSSTLFIADCLNATNSSYLDVSNVMLSSGESTANLWQYLALEIQRQLGRGTDTGKFRTQFNDVLANYAKNYSYGTTKNLSSGDNDYDVTSSGLQHSYSMKDAGAAIESQIYKWYKNADGSRDQKTSKASKSAVWQNSTLAENTSSQDVFWTVISANKTSGTFKQGHYQAVAVLFSDFTLSPIIPEDSGNNYVTYSSEPSRENLSSSAVTNESSSYADKTVVFSQTETCEVISTVNGSKEYTFGQSIGVDVKIGRDKDLVNVTVSGELTFGQAIQEGWSNSSGTSKSTSYESRVSVTVPPYATSLATTEKTKWTENTKYNCPVVLGFKLTVVEYTLDPSSNGADAKTQVLATYGNARSDLFKCAVTEKSITSMDKMNWASTNNSADAVAAKLAATAPMSGTGASLSVAYDVTHSKISGFVPIYPLTKIKAVGLNEINLVPGGYIYVSDIDLQGYNNQKNDNGEFGVYYGFNESKGHWVLLDADDKEIGNGDASSPAVLETDAVTGEVTLKAQSQGTVYLKYIIDENCYGTSNAADGFATNDKITTAIIKVIVENRLMGASRPYIEEQTSNRSVDVTRENMLEKIRELNLAANIVDPENGNVVSYLLYKTDSASIADGERIYQGMIDFLDAGVYYIRANVGNNYSEMVTLVLKDTMLDSLYIPSAHTVDQGDTMNLQGVVAHSYANGLPCSVSDVKWYADDVLLEDGIITFARAGSVSVYAVCDGVRSNEMVITVLPVEDSVATPDEILPSDDEVPPSDEGEGTTPPTGDGTMLLFWIMLAASALFSAIALGKNRKEF